jgi:hypothetical protein
MSSVPTGRERVDARLASAIKCIKRMQDPGLNKKSNKEELIASLSARLSRTKKSLVFLSAHARDPITRFFASNALKEIAKKLSK